jgi:drug/metabolite transporter (DMT)-like permease
VAWSLGAGAAYAYYALHAEVLTRTRTPAAVLALGLAFGSAALAVVAPWWAFPFDALVGSGAVGPLSVPVWLGVAWVVMLGTVIPFTLLITGVRMIGADGAIVTAMLEPVFAGIVAWVVLGQVLAPAQIAGGAIVLAAVTVAQVARARAAATG